MQHHKLQVQEVGVARHQVSFLSSALLSGGASCLPRPLAHESMCNLVFAQVFANLLSQWAGAGSEFAEACIKLCSGCIRTRRCDVAIQTEDWF